MKPTKKIYYALLILIANGAIYASDTRDKAYISERLQWIEHAYPVQDANVSIIQGDCRLRTVRASITLYPGVDERFIDKYRALYGEYMIEGTSDSFPISNQTIMLSKFQSKAVKYAEKYNQIIADAIAKEKCKKRDVDYVPSALETVSNEEVF